jgi:hypothetical protein
MSMSIKSSGRTRSASRVGMRRSPTPTQKTISKAIQAPAEHRRKVRAKSIPETRVVIHPPLDISSADISAGRTRSNPLVYEAMDLLRKYGYDPARLTEPGMPVNIIAMKKSGSLLILALRSRLPVPSAARLNELFTAKVDSLRAMVTRVQEKIMIWVYSPACGWRYYLVYPGGLRYDLEFPKSIG